MGDESGLERDVEKVRYQNVDELFKNATPSTIAEDVARIIEIRSLKGTYSRDYLINVLGYSAGEIDSVEPMEPEGRRQAEDWNSLAGLIVGQEHLGPQRFP